MEVDQSHKRLNLPFEVQTAEKRPNKVHINNKLSSDRRKTLTKATMLVPPPPLPPQQTLYLFDLVRRHFLLAISQYGAFVLCHSVVALLPVFGSPCVNDS